MGHEVRAMRMMMPIWAMHDYMPFIDDLGLLVIFSVPWYLWEFTSFCIRYPPLLSVAD